MKPTSRLFLFIGLSLVISLALGWVIAWLSGDPVLAVGGWVTGLLLFVLSLSLAALWKLVGGGQALGWLLAGAFLLRLVVGTGLDGGLPRYGYPDSQEHRGGYFYTDAQRRDNSALALARSSEPLAQAFSHEIITDQYGGLLSLSAWVYRYLSPDAHRPYLVMLLGAAAGAAGLVFVWALTRRRWGYGPALTAGLVFALYPQSVILGATQMREPYLISTAAAALWAMVAIHDSPMNPPRRVKAGVVLVLSLVVMAFFSTRIALAAAAVSAVYLLWEGAARLSPRWKPALIALLAGGILLSLLLTWNWLRNSTLYDAYLTETQSGWVQQVFDLIPEQAQVPFIIGYGLAQPVLPATISDLALPLLVPLGDEALVNLAPGLLRQVNFWLALGWYVILPVFVYALFAVWRVRPQEDHRLLIILVLFVLTWALISSARAGGDQWDNPRYRTIFIGWQAVLFAWGVHHARQVRDAWLVRWYLVTGIFVFFFTEWYISRYSRLIGRPSFFTLIGAIIGLSMLVLAGGWLWDRFRRRPGLTNPAEKL